MFDAETGAAPSANIEKINGQIENVKDYGHGYRIEVTTDDGDKISSLVVEDNMSSRISDIFEHIDLSPESSAGKVVEGMPVEITMSNYRDEKSIEALRATPRTENFIRDIEKRILDKSEGKKMDSYSYIYEDPPQGAHIINVNCNEAFSSNVVEVVGRELAGAKVATDVERAIREEIHATQGDNLSSEAKNLIASKIVEYSERRGLDPILIASLIKQESRFVPDNVGADEDSGLMQILPSTAEGITEELGISYSRDMLYDIETNIRMGTHYLAKRLQQLGSEDRALVAYNAGYDTGESIQDPSSFGYVYDVRKHYPDIEARLQPKDEQDLELDATEVVRLLGVGNPTSSQHDTPFNARSLLNRLVQNQPAKLEICSEAASDGRDARDRVVGTLWVQSGEGYFNLNKTMVTHPSIPSVGELSCNADNIRQYDSDDASERISMTEDERISNANDIPRVDDRQELLPFHMRIGDTQFAIPPSSIMVNTVTETEGIPSLRQRGTSKTQSGHMEKIVEIEIYFSGEDEINGKKISSNNAPDDMLIADGKEYYINGLRSLIAQFKRAPFLPVENEYLNDNHEILALTLESVSIENLPGFPNTLVARLVARDFNWDAYMPFEIDFGSTFNWPLFRYYYQKDLLEDPNPKLKKYQRKQSRDEKDIKFHIASERQLMEAREASRKMRDILPVDAGAIADQMLEQMPRERQLRSDYEKLQIALRQKRDYEDFYLNADELPTKNQTINMPNPGVGGYGGHGPGRELETDNREEISFSDFISQNYDEQYFFPDGASKSDSIGPFATSGEPVDVINIPIQTEEFRGIFNDEIVGTVLFDGDGIRVQDGNRISIPFTMEGQKLINKIKRKGKEAKEKIEEKQREVYDSQQEQFGDLTASAYVYEDELETLEYEMDDLYLKSISVSQQNILTKSQMESQETPTHQYMGSQDVNIRLRLQTDSRQTVELISDMIKDTGTIAREYREHIIAGILHVENNIINMFGVKSVLIQSCTISTSQDSPELYEIEMILIDFDKTQRKREDLHEIHGPTGDYDERSHNEIKDNLQRLHDEDFMGTAGIEFEKQMQSAELYPDLELPTYEEAEKIMRDLFGNQGFFYNSNGAKYVDPDFYIGVPMTFSDELVNNLDKGQVDGQQIQNSLFLEDMMTEHNGERLKGEVRTPRFDENGRVIDDGRIGLTGSALELYDIVANKSGSSLDLDGEGSLDEDTIRGVNNHDALVKILYKNSRRDKKNPDITDIVRLMVSEIRDQFGFFGRGRELITNIFDFDSEDPAYVELNKYAIAICIRGSNTFQYVTIDDRTVQGKHIKKIVPHINREDHGIGLMQISPFKHDNIDFNEETILNLGYDWEQNIKKGIELLHNYYEEARNISMDKTLSPEISENPAQWAVIAYGLGGLEDARQAGIEAMKSLAPQDEDDSIYGRIPYYQEIIRIIDNYFYDDTDEKKYQGEGRIYDKDILESIREQEKELADNYVDPESVSTTPNAKIDRTRRPQDDGGIKPGDGDAEYGSKNIEESEHEKSYRLSMVDMEKYDQRGRLVRAFPTFQLYIVDEGRWLTWHRLWDNLYGYNALSSIDVHKSRKTAADTCKLVINNVYSTINSKDPHYEYERQSLTLMNWITPWLSPSEEMIRMRQRDLSELMLKPGGRIHLRMGYSADASRLPIVFNGTVTEMETKDVCTIIAQGDGVELTNTLHANDKDEATGGIFQPGRTEPRNVIMWLLDHRTWFNKWIKEGVFNWKDQSSKDSARGVVHFGNPRYSPLNFYKHKGAEIGQNVYSASSDTNDAAWRDIPVEIGEWLWLPGSLGNNEPKLRVFLYDKTPWDIIQTMRMSVPDFIAYVHPFDLRSTLFYGKKSWGLAYKYDYEYTVEDGKIIARDVKELRKSFQQFREYDSVTDIIFNNVKASEHGMYTNVIGMWSSDNYDTPNNNITVRADANIYPEKQTTTMVHTQLKSRMWDSIPLLDTTEKLATNIAISELDDHMREMYQGQLIVMGDPSMKPHDMCFMYDTYNEMSGNIEVEGVVHSMNIETGFTSAITPDPCITQHDPAQINRWNWAAATFSTYALKKHLNYIGVKTGRKILTSAKSGKIASGASWAKGQMHSKLPSVYKKGSSAWATGKTVGSKLKSWIAGSGAAKGTKGIVAKIAGLTIGGIKLGPLLAMAGVVYVSWNLIDMLQRNMFRRQAIVMAPLLQYGRKYYAGIQGHSGLVVGDNPSAKRNIIESSLSWLVEVDREYDVDYYDYLREMQTSDGGEYMTSIALDKKEGSEHDSPSGGGQGSASPRGVSSSDNRFDVLEGTSFEVYAGKQRQEHIKELSMRVEAGEVNLVNLNEHEEIFRLAPMNISRFPQLLRVTEDRVEKFRKFGKLFREHFGKRPTVNSAHRTFRHNLHSAKSGAPVSGIDADLTPTLLSEEGVNVYDLPDSGRSGSPHSAAIALDIHAASLDEAKEIADFANKFGFGGIAIGGSYFVHIDDSAVARWNYGSTYKYTEPNMTISSRTGGGRAQGPSS